MPVLCREVAVIGGAHILVFGADVRLVGVGAGGTPRGNLAVGNTAVDAGLLTVGACIDAMPLMVRGGLREGCGEWQRSEAGSKNKMVNAHERAFSVGCGPLAVFGKSRSYRTYRDPDWRLWLR